MKREISWRGENYRVAAIFTLGLLCAVCLLGNQAAGQRTDSLFIRNSEGKLLKAEVEGTNYSLIKVDCPAFTIQHAAGNVSPVTIKIDYKSVKIATSSDTLCWLTQNLGASVQANAVSDATDEAAGWYWQFNRKQGWSINTSNEYIPSKDGFSTSAYNETVDWQPENDPCSLLLGNAWRIPTQSEWQNVINILNAKTPANAFNSILKLHEAGMVYLSTKVLSYRGSTGGTLLWTSTSTSATAASRVWIGSSYDLLGRDKWRGIAMRCVRSLPE